MLSIDIDRAHALSVATLARRVYLSTVQVEQLEHDIDTDTRTLDDNIVYMSEDACKEALSLLSGTQHEYQLVRSAIIAKHPEWLWAGEA